MTDKPGAKAAVPLLFYTTAGCHLCEQAAEMLEQLTQRHRVVVEPIDIATDEALVAAYGIRIPVVKNVATQVELGWPFQLDQLISLV